MKFAYADPPYYGNGKKRYGELHDEAEQFDSIDSHLLLVAKLVSEYPDGWVLSCNPADLKWLLPVCPDDCRVGAWVKSYHQIRPTTVQYSWEPVIFRGGRKDNKRQPMVRDWLEAPVTKNKKVPGAKPKSFNAWVLALLNFNHQEDTLDDLFPGSGGMNVALSEPTLVFE